MDTDAIGSGIVVMREQLHGPIEELTRSSVIIEALCFSSIIIARVLAVEAD